MLQSFPVKSKLKHIRTLKKLIADIYKTKLSMETKSQIKRKQDAHNKIQMGGLIVKAGLDYLHPKESAILLGILVDAKQKLESDDKYEYIDYYQKLGFKEFDKKNGS